MNKTILYKALSAHYENLSMVLKHDNMISDSPYNEDTFIKKHIEMKQELKITETYLENLKPFVDPTYIDAIASFRICADICDYNLTLCEYQIKESKI